MKGIMYHYVRKKNKNLPHFKYLDIEDFKKQLDYFRDKFGFASKKDFFNSLNTGNPITGVILTFDDGLKDHYRYVLPELLKRNLWGIFYVPYQAHRRDKLLGPHRVHMLLGKFGGKRIMESLSKIISKKMLVHKHVRSFRTLTYKGLTDDHLSTEVKRILNFYIDEKYREKTLDKLMKLFFKNELSMVRNLYLNKKEITRMAQVGMIIGAHTVNHPVMSKLKREKQKKEILPCFKFIGKITSKSMPKTYCHPYGGPFSFNVDTVDILNGIHCLFSFSVEPRDIETNDLKKHNQSLPRYDCNLFPHGKTRT